MQLIFVLNESKMIIFHVLSCRHEIVRYNFCQRFIYAILIGEHGIYLYV